MKKVVFVVTSLDVGGIETYLLRFIQILDGRLDVTVMCKRGNIGFLGKRYEEANASVIPLKLGWISVKDYLKLYRYLKCENFDVICDFTGDFAGPILFVAKMSGVKNRLAFYRGTEYQFKRTKLKLLYARVSRCLTKLCSTKILSNSRKALDNFHPNWEKRRNFYEVIRNGVPTYSLLSPEEQSLKREELGVPLGAFLIGHTGRYCHAKNHVKILEVALPLILENKSVYFFLCGRGVKGSIDNLVQNTPLEGRIIAQETRDDVGEILQCFDAFYFPSLNEGMPNSLIEAMSIGLPFVASDIDSIREILPGKFHNYLVCPNDAARAKELLASLVADRNLFPSQELSRWTLQEYHMSRQLNTFYCALGGLE